MSISSVSASGAVFSWEEILSQAKEKKAEQGDALADLFSTLAGGGKGGADLQESASNEEAFAALDANRDGVVSLDELMDALELQRKALMTRMSLDESENAAASSASGAEGATQARTTLEEALGGANAQSTFDPMDTNQDGVVSPEELYAALQQQASLAGDSGSGAGKGIGEKIADSILSLASQAYGALSKTTASAQTVSVKA
jgi:Ca2+-binding EF-hand superfamily protein